MPQVACRFVKGAGVEASPLKYSIVKYLGQKARENPGLFPLSLVPATKQWKQFTDISGKTPP